MNLLKISWKNILYRPLSSGLSVLLLVSGISIILITLLTLHQIEDKFKNNIGGVDLIIAAEGSRLQSVLCNLYQIDKPTGNINYARTGFVRMHPMVKKAIPLSIGDNYKTYRILATTHDYVDLYNGKIAKGKLWERPMEATLGSEVARKFNLKIGDKFSGGHGLGESIEEHKGQQYVVVGILEPSNTVLDNLLLTSLESVWILHADHDHKAKGDFDIISKEQHEENLKKREEEHHHHDHHEIAPQDFDAILKTIDIRDREITSMLVQYKTPRARFTLPGIANNTDGMMAAEPAIEIMQLFELIEPAVKIIGIMTLVIVIIASLSMFVAMINSLKDRQYEIAIMRTMGATTRKVFGMILIEGFLLAVTGYVLGTIVSHLGMEFFSGYLAKNYHYNFTGFIFLQEELYLFLGAVIIGIVSALYPAFKAYKTDISKVLSA